MRKMKTIEYILTKLEQFNDFPKGDAVTFSLPIPIKESNKLIDTYFIYSSIENNELGYLPIYRIIVPLDSEKGITYERIDQLLIDRLGLEHFKNETLQSDMSLDEYEDLYELYEKKIELYRRYLDENELLLSANLKGEILKLVKGLTLSSHHKVYEIFFGGE